MKSSTAECGIRRKDDRTEHLDGTQVWRTYLLKHPIKVQALNSNPGDSTQGPDIPSSVQILKLINKQMQSVKMDSTVSLDSSCRKSDFPRCEESQSFGNALPQRNMQ